MPDHPITAEEFHRFMDVERGATIPPKGFYWMVHSAERAEMVQYHIINWLINVLLIVQAALSAVFVALSAARNKYQEPLPFLEASTAPSRGCWLSSRARGYQPRFYQHASGLREVMREVGRLERIVASGGMVTREDCESLYAMYDGVQKEYDANYPDIFRVVESSSMPSLIPTRPEPEGADIQADGGAAVAGAAGAGEAVE